jgi:hypothetical protein
MRHKKESHVEDAKAGTTDSNQPVDQAALELPASAPIALLQAFSVHGDPPVA